MERAQVRKKSRGKYIMLTLLSVLAIISIVKIFQYRTDVRTAYKKLDAYPVQAINTEFGKMSFIDNGIGDPILLSHGIFGGYDQGYESLKGLVGDNFRKLVPSRFGYPGSEVPEEPIPENQAKAFVELMDELNIDKTYVITTSAGGAAGIMMTLRYPERVKGLIMVSSGMPDIKRTKEDIKGITGPPAIMVNDFPMWLTIKHFSFVIKSMMGVKESSEAIFSTMLPVTPRKKGIQIDTNITNLEMDLNYEAYTSEKITVPILMIHAKDDPMVKFETTANFKKRTHPQTLFFETGGHLIEGHGDEVSKAIISFIEANGDK